MCLTKLKRFKVRMNKDGIGRGWKAFEMRDGELYPLCVTGKPFLVNQWIHEKDFRPSYAKDVIKCGEKSYPNGFHVFNPGSNPMI